MTRCLLDWNYGCFSFQISVLLTSYSKHYYYNWKRIKLIFNATFPTCSKITKNGMSNIKSNQYKTVYVQPLSFTCLQHKKHLLTEKQPAII